MKYSIELMNEYLHEKTTDSGIGSIVSITEQLYQNYLHSSGIESEEVRKTLGAVEGFLERFSIKGQSRIWDAILLLCGAYEKQGFLDGFHMGVRLMMEIWEREQGELSQTVSSNVPHGMPQSTF